ncbi:hypothetical protein EVAR_38606_1 [Eumeta japonica]|uniref:Uncharacterized protein n=1 Tax=Eumeta variegata TaxID=151549 RepID=A0A4C1WRN6_EUMVA|nr:hypothetical protein EVAR_38606_1 [Eumeta japonica]
MATFRTASFTYVAQSEQFNLIEKISCPVIRTDAATSAAVYHHCSIGHHVRGKITAPDEESGEEDDDVIENDREDNSDIDDSDNNSAADSDTE